MKLCLKARILLAILFVGMIAVVPSISYGQQLIRVGAFDNFPVVFKDSQGKPAGIYVDLLNEIASEQNWQLEFVFDSLPNCLKNLSDSSIDLMTSIARQKERELYCEFSNEEVLTVYGVVYLLPDSDIQNILDLDKKKVGILKGSFLKPDFIRMCQRFEIECEVMEFESYDAILGAVQKKDVQAGILNNIHGEACLQNFDVRSSAILLTPSSLFFAAPKSQGDLLRVIDSKISDWKKDKKSFFYSVTKKWYGHTMHQIQMGRLLTSWLKYGFLVLIFVVFILFAWLKSVKIQVRKNTQELYRANKDLQREIEERHKAEKSITQQREQYRATTENNSDCIVRCDGDAKLLFANTATLVVNRLGDKEYIGKTFRELGLSAEFCTLLEKNIKKAFSSKKSVKSEYEAFENARFISLEITLSPEFDEHGDVCSVIGISRDVTARRKSELESMELEKMLQHAQRLEAVGTLAGGIAHDFNNILMPILGYADLIDAELDDNNPIKESIHEIHAAALRGRDLARQILVFSRQSEPDLQPIKLQEVLNEALRLVRATLPSTIVINKSVDENCAQVYGDPSRFHQIAMNLVTNAFHAMSDVGGTLSISLKEVYIYKREDTPSLDLGPGHYALLEISDTGVGIDKMILERIFEPYFTTKKHGKGSGLGLAVVHGIVKKMGGDIIVATEKGIGTSFKVYFPCLAAEVGLKKEDEDSAIVGGNETILAVDDEEMITRLEKRMLESIGYKVMVASNGKEALSIFKESYDKIDLVLSDMTMPGMTGDKLAIEILKMKKLPVLICTGFSENISSEGVQQVGITGLLLKPLTIRELAEKVRDAIDHF